MASGCEIVRKVRNRGEGGFARQATPEDANNLHHCCGEGEAPFAWEIKLHVTTCRLPAVVKMTLMLSNWVIELKIP
jgi:hypothetical protein